MNSVSRTPRLPPADRPVLAVCGRSGSGKTTLLEAAIRELTTRGLTVGAVKHHSHGFSIDREGKDSDRLFRAGANVCLRGSEEVAWRWQPDAGTGLERTIDRLLARCDLVLVEGYRETPIAKIWLGGPAGDMAPDGVSGIVESLPWGTGRVQRLLAIVDDLLERVWSSRPVLGGLLVGGGSRRMGRPKQLLDYRYRGRNLATIVHDALADRSDRVVVLGDGELPGDLRHLPRIPDPPGLRGPMAGLLAALRWAPSAAWLLAAIDLPLVTPEALEWLLGQRRPGVRALLPRAAPERIEPLLAFYEPHAREALEELAASGWLAPRRLRGLPGIESPLVPSHLAAAWTNVNRPEDLQNLPG